MEAQLLGNYLGGLATGEPVLDGFTLERFIELTTGFDRVFFDGFHVTRFTQFSVRQFEATLHRLPGRGKSGAELHGQGGNFTSPKYRKFQGVDFRRCQVILKNI
jgi:hypothetical protein